MKTTQWLNIIALERMWSTPRQQLGITGGGKSAGTYFWFNIETCVAYSIILSSNQRLWQWLQKALLVLLGLLLPVLKNELRNGKLFLECC